MVLVRKVTTTSGAVAQAAHTIPRNATGGAQVGELALWGVYTGPQVQGRRAPSSSGVHLPRLGNVFHHVERVLLWTDVA